MRWHAFPILGVAFALAACTRDEPDTDGPTALEIAVGRAGSDGLKTGPFAEVTVHLDVAGVRTTTTTDTDGIATFELGLDGVDAVDITMDSGMGHLVTRLGVPVSEAEEPWLLLDYPPVPASTTIHGIVTNRTPDTTLLVLGEPSPFSAYQDDTDDFTVDVPTDATASLLAIEFTGHTEPWPEMLGQSVEGVYTVLTQEFVSWTWLDVGPVSAPTEIDVVLTGDATVESGTVSVMGNTKWWVYGRVHSNLHPSRPIGYPTLVTPTVGDGTPYRLDFEWAPAPEGGSPVTQIDASNDDYTAETLVRGAPDEQDAPIELLPFARLVRNAGLGEEFELHSVPEDAEMSLLLMTSTAAWRVFAPPGERTLTLPEVPASLGWDPTSPPSDMMVIPEITRLADDPDDILPLAFGRGQPYAAFP